MADKKIYCDNPDCDLTHNKAEIFKKRMTYLDYLINSKLCCSHLEEYHKKILEEWLNLISNLPSSSDEEKYVRKEEVNDFIIFRNWIDNYWGRSLFG